jgi:hypothetical protein
MVKLFSFGLEAHAKIANLPLPQVGVWGLLLVKVGGLKLVTSQAR